MDGTEARVAGSVLATEAVVEALGRVLESDSFARSGRSRGFLAYVVAETLAGRGDRLSERTVGRAAMQRDARFDGTQEATVRVQATRVRQRLEDYYSREGVNDPIRITLPRGSYAPVFEHRDVQGQGVSRVPGVVVVLLTSSGDDRAASVARAMTESLVHNLAAHTHIRVVGPIDSVAGAGQSAAAARVTTILSGHVRVAEDRLAITVRLADAASGEVLWSTEETHPVEDLARFEADERWSRQVAATLGDPSGVVIRRELGRRDTSGAEPEIAARLAFYAHLLRETMASLTEAIERADAALAAGIRTAPLLAMRGALANSASVYEGADTDRELDRAESFAREALSLDGDNAHAHLVLSWPTLMRGHTQVAIEHIDAAVRLAPYQPFSLVAAGIALSASGQWHRGAELIREAHRLNPGMSSLTRGWLAMGHLVEGEYGSALAEASLLPSDDDYGWGSLMRALALAGLGYEDQAQEEAERLRRMRPDLTADVGGFLDGMMRLTPEQRARLVALMPRESTGP